MTRFIVYACPTGELAQQLEVYFEKSRLLCGPNAAHRYMPHCTLTGFFEDFSNAVPKYTQTLERSFKRFRGSLPSPPLEVHSMAFREDWHGLELSSDWLKKLMWNFACTATSPTRKTPLRLKDWLHLSLAYDFLPDQAPRLEELAQDLVDPAVETQWELRFYQQNPDKTWVCHQKIKLEAS